MTPNEATILGGLGGAAFGAFFGGLTAFFTTRYIVKHGPNYSAQIDSTNNALAALAATQEEMRKQHASGLESDKEHRADQERKAEAARWKPIVKLVSEQRGSEWINELHLKDSHNFFVVEIALIGPTGAKLHEYSISKNLASTGFRVPIPGDSINKITMNNQQFFQIETFDGGIRYTVQRETKDNTRYTGEVPFHGERAMVNNTCFYKLLG